jgi:hypothetical protein
MPRKLLAISIAATALASCSEQTTEETPQAMIAEVEPLGTGEGAPQNSFGFMEAMEPGFDLTGQHAQAARRTALRNAVDIADRETARPAEAASAAGDQIAYSYGFGFQIDGDKISELQTAHVAQCEAMGSSCRVLRMSTASMDDWDGYGELKLQIAAELAASFGDSITKPANDLGGELVSSVRDGEDLAEQIIDTEARLASRLLLRDKLTAILAGNRGSVDELVKAEKAVADVNEEIDSTRTKLEKFRNGIRFSDVEIKYEPYFGQSQVGFGRPVVEALRSIGSTLGSATAILIYGLTALVPFVLFALLLRWVLRRFGLRIRFWKKRNITA